MLVNLLLQDGKSNYMEGLMRKSNSSLPLADISHRPLPRHRSLVHSVVMEYSGGVEAKEEPHTRIYIYIYPIPEYASIPWTFFRYLQDCT